MTHKEPHIALLATPRRLLEERLDMRACTQEITEGLHDHQRCVRDRLRRVVLVVKVVAQLRRVVRVDDGLEELVVGLVVVESDLVEGEEDLVGGHVHVVVHVDEEHDLRGQDDHCAHEAVGLQEELLVGQVVLFGARRLHQEVRLMIKI